MPDALPRDHQSLIAALERGETFDYLFFWGHRQRERGRVDASCLSQWFPASFTVDGVRYRTAEHFMMAGKARLFGDSANLEKILAAEGPDAAKKLGRRVTPFDERVWAAHRSELVVHGNVAKFDQNRALGEFLASTETRMLVEASPRDRVWGIGLGRTNPDARDPTKWRGENLLGFALVEARARLAAR
jgi:ribA/ribD-fused uncharacterized protein